MRKRLVIVGAIIGAVILLTVMLASFWFRPASPTKIIGNIPQTDVDQIERIVRREMRKEIFPSFSWQSIKGLPSSLRNHWNYRILLVDAQMNNRVEVTVGFKGDSQSSGHSYFLAKTDQTWGVKHEIYRVGDIVITLDPPISP